jgi:hypothetical protein
MATLGPLIQQVGIVMFVGGFGLYMASIAYGMARIFRWERFQQQAFLP